MFVAGAYLVVRIGILGRVLAQNLHYAPPAFDPDAGTFFSMFRFPARPLVISLAIETMGKSDAEVMALFNGQVNMTADELEKWLEDP